MFRVYPSRINGMSGMISSLLPKRDIVRTLSKWRGTDSTAAYVRVADGISVGFTHDAGTAPGSGLLIRRNLQLRNHTECARKASEQAEP